MVAPESNMGFTTVSDERYKELLKAERKLDLLEAHGVDNWQFYDDAMHEIYMEADSE